jgi:transposase InsO family protein
MPWMSGTIMDSRLEFIRLVEQGDLTMTELCRRFGISRQTGYLYLNRFRQGGAEALTSRSSRPHSSPRRTPAPMEAEILALRAKHPCWGGRKLARRLADLNHTGVPRPSTVTEVLRRHGRLDPAETAQRQAWQRFEHPNPNDLWQMDFKGHVAMDHGRCHPLTILDDHSRYLLGLFACANEQQETVQAHLTAVFRRHGMPLGLLCDNGSHGGSPWGNRGIEGFTELEVWLLRCGVRMRHGKPFHPQTQGKDERFHRTLKVEMLQAQRLVDLTASQPLFDQYRHVYNPASQHPSVYVIEANRVS